MRRALADPAQPLNARPIAREFLDRAAEQGGDDPLGGAAVAIEVRADSGGQCGRRAGPRRRGRCARDRCRRAAPRPPRRLRAARWRRAGRAPVLPSATASSCTPPESVRTRWARCIRRTKRGRSSGGEQADVGMAAQRRLRRRAQRGIGVEREEDLDVGALGELRQSGADRRERRAEALAAMGGDEDQLAARRDRAAAPASIAARSVGVARRAGRAPGRARRCRYCR